MKNLQHIEKSAANTLAPVAAKFGPSSRPRPLTANGAPSISAPPAEYRYGCTLTELDTYFHSLSSVASAEEDRPLKQSAIQRAQHMLCQAYIAHLDRAIHRKP